MTDRNVELHAIIRLSTQSTTTDLVLPHIHPKDESVPSRAGLFVREHPPRDGIRALTIEAVSIDDRLMLTQSKHAGLVITRLWQRRHTTYFHEAKTHCVHRGVALAILIKARSESEWVAQAQAEHARPQRVRVVAEFTRGESHTGRPHCLYSETRVK